MQNRAPSNETKDRIIEKEISKFKNLPPYIEARVIERLESKIDTIGKKIDYLASQVAAMNIRLNKVENSLDTERKNEDDGKEYTLHTQFGDVKGRLIKAEATLSPADEAESRTDLGQQAQWVRK